MSKDDAPAEQGTESVKSVTPAEEPKPVSGLAREPASRDDLAEVKQELAGAEKKMGDFERSTLLWTKASFIVILFTGLFIGLQWREMRSGGTDTHELAVQAKNQADKMKSVSDAADKIRKAAEGMVTQETRIADNAQKAFEASSKQSESAITAARDSVRTDQRAWLGVGDLSAPDFGIDKPFIVTVYFRNTGKTPALDTTASYTIRPGDPNFPDFSQLDPATSHGIIFPQGQSRITLNATRKTDNKLPADSFNRIKNGDAVILIYGVVTYKDVFEHQHWAKSCAFFDVKTGNFSQCTHNNEIDKDSR